ncbi:MULTISPECIES: DUF2178 domain-containing protein [unclassified Fusibacter]|uniref:DUF2178 domain-containing protein n=1 Tax=unclassified Fusibacter TaxID=2624464 RepID=UPI001013B569|nr:MULTISPECIES: DUF2178 domain-containing protein [unclassified Fusibacter]MCK8058391.1 DUF2178 domain-containing protein [Fusibacter sp. A2]NPE20974.1 DUF2178 domain-containing protein [Fusibacter sp. A1]RXV63174.1 DUF2178 domain-containing protein [Fusibacter sp. A1]
MSKPMKFSIIQVGAWLLIGIILLLVFNQEGVVEQWGDNQNKTLLVASLFIFGFSSDFILRLIEKSKRHGFSRDERDQLIQSKAMNFGFILTLIYVFLVTITLYVKYEDAGLMPVGYMWFVAYSTIVIANLSMGIPSICYYKKQGY